jgi:hypothetical protein
MTSKEIILSQAEYSGEVVTDAHFGANVLMTMNFLDPGGTFDRLLQQLGTVDLRYPGGSLSENLSFETGDRLWDVDNPSGVSDTGLPRLTTVPAFLDYAADHKVEAIIVVPTEPFMTDGAYGTRDVAAWGMYQVMTRIDMMVDNFYGDSRITTVSIGNEYWYNDERMTAEEYGKVANEYAIGLQYLFDVHTADLKALGIAWDDPDISIQAPQACDVLDSQQILAQLDLDAREAIDMVETHFYPRLYNRIDDFDNVWARVDEIKDAPGFGDLKTFVSEWNVKSDTESDFGLLQGTDLLEMMEVMLNEGVDAASIWGLQYTQLKTRLSTLYPDADSPSGYGYHLSAAGEVFHWMAEDLPGTRVMDLGVIDPTGGIESHAFGSDDHVTIFLSSMTGEPQDIVLNISDLVPNYAHFWGAELGVMDDPMTVANEADPLNPGNIPCVQTFNGSIIDAEGNIHLHFDAYEIAQLNFQLNDDGVHMYGQATEPMEAMHHDDNLVGGAGGDLIEGFVGNDVLRGLGGNDAIFGGAGNDYLNGGTGNDLVDGGTGLDTVDGHSGNDTLVGLTGDTTMTGGSGTDHFILTTDTNTVITDFGDVAGQTISFVDHYTDLTDVMSRVTSDGNDLLITHDDGFFTRLVDMAGQENVLAASLADFMDVSPVEDIVTKLQEPIPDGSIPENPEPGTNPELLHTDDLTYAQEILKMDPDQVAELAASFTSDNFDEFLGRIDPDIFFYCMRPEELAAFMNGLDDDLRQMLLDDLSSEGVAFKLLRMQGDVGDFLSQLDADPLVDLISLVPDEDTQVISPRISTSMRSVLQDRVETVVGDNPNHPLAEFFVENQDDADPETDPETDTDPDPVGSSGCFVATAAYGDLRHPEVEYLRLVRDMVLINHSWGRVFIKVYWTIGPKLARFVAPRPVLRRASVAVLHRIVTLLQRRRVLQKHGVLPMERLRRQR